MSVASSPVRQLRQKVLALLEASDPYPFLSIVEDYLLALPADGAVRAEAVRELFTYDAVVSRLMAFLRERLSTQQ
ncbi:MAG TPA: hypothetical protein PKY77_14545 [Phycisphaerae bacterium]|nr:hypothetical protein [Phycisphaerae bacterium]HRY67474.1 hypothetical protein [Phycisphaerae bacterium]HSA27933.1 hypothetical protein [Phycisphaerae bacterium]